MSRTALTASLLLTLCIGVQQFGTAQSGPVVTFERRSYPIAGNPRAVVAADFNRDGKPDFATANLNLAGGTASGVAVSLNLGDGTFGAPATIETDFGAFELVAADVNRDGRVDLVVANASSNTVTTLLGTAAGFADAFTWQTSAGPRSIIAGDFTRDGRLDMAIAGFDCDCVNIGRGNGDGSFTTVTTFAVGHQPEELMAGDMNRDGTLDLMIGHLDGTIHVLYGAASATFVPVNSDPAAQRTRGMDAADFDRNGFIDFVLVGDEKLRVVLTPQVGIYGASVLSDTRGVAAIDVDSDGWPDIASASRAGNTVQVLMNLTTAQSGINFRFPQDRFFSGAGARDIAVADVDGDGRPDMMVANEGAGTVAVFRNRTALAPASTVIR